MEQLIRVAWIITFRREQGESIDKHKERSIIFKWFRYAKFVAKTEYYRTIDEKNKMGLHMTDSKVALEQEVERLADFSSAKKPKRFTRH